MRKERARREGMIKIMELGKENEKRKRGKGTRQKQENGWEKKTGDWMRKMRRIDKMRKMKEKRKTGEGKPEKWTTETRKSGRGKKK